MPLDPLHSEYFVMMSLVKYFTDTLGVEDNLLVRFKPGFSPIADETKWVAIQMGSLNGLNTGDSNFTVYLCTRNDPDGIELAKLSDVVRNRLIDEDSLDTRRGIPIYNTEKDPWEIINYMKLTTILDNNRYDDPDGTTYKVISVRGWSPTR